MRRFHFVSRNTHPPEYPISYGQSFQKNEGVVFICENTFVCEVAGGKNLDMGRKWTQQGGNFLVLVRPFVELVMPVF